MAKFKDDLDRESKEVENKGNNRGRGKGRQTRKNKSNRRNGARDQRNDYDNGSNDFNWYNTLPELIVSSANFPFGRPLGTELTFTQGHQYNGTTSNGNTLDYYRDSRLGSKVPTSIPGFMFIHWNPTIGVSTDGNSPVNVTARNIYSFVRHANSGAANYDSTDLMIYLLAMDSIYSCYQGALRAYGYLNLYSPTNRYMPRYIVEGLGFDFDDLIANQAQFAFAINNIAYKIGSFAVPNFMSYYLRHMWMNANTYRDAPNMKAQVYGFVEDTVFQYDDSYEEGTDNKTFAGLRRVNTPWSRPTEPCTLDKWITFMNGLINPILASEDMGIMSGDILKAFGAQNLFTVAPIDPNYAIDPVYNEEVLTQIQNLTIIGDVASDATISESSGSTLLTGDIIQPVNANTGEGYLYSYPSFWAGSTQDNYNSALNAIMIDQLLTSREDVPSKEFVTVATRLMNRMDYYYNSGSAEEANRYFVDSSHGLSTEVVSRIDLVYNNNGDVVINTINGAGLLFGTSDGGFIDTPLVMACTLAALSKFDWQPTIPIQYCDGTEGEIAHWIGYYQDTTNYSIMTSEDLTNIHDAVLMSEFYIPQIAGATRKPIPTK